MKRRFYLRGIGVGMVLTVVLYSTIIIPGKYELSDEEVMARAESLGMVMEEDVTLPEPSPSGEPTPSGAEEVSTTPEPTMPEEPTMPPEPTKALTPTPLPTPTDIPEPTDVPEPTKALTPTPLPTPTEKLEPTKALTPTPQPTPTEKPEPTNTPEPTPEQGAAEGKKITISIVKGMWSAQFAKAAQEAGLIDDAEAFDQYLMQNGFASKIRIGTYTFTSGDSYYDIAKKVTTPQ